MYPFKGFLGVENLFLIYTGITMGSDGTKHPQYWTINDFKPVLMHIDSITNKPDDDMITDFLFMAISIEDKNGNIKYIVRNDKSPANYDDWQLYKNDLFSAGKNLNALFTLSKYNELNRQINTDVWISLPYPHPKIFGNDSNRSAMVCRWIDSFLSTWNLFNYSSRLNLKGFYCNQESEYYNNYLYDDGRMMLLVNNYIHNKGLKSLWIPYQQANGWNKWKEFGFDLSILQPSYYFDSTKSLTAGLVDAYINGQGVEMEFDLSVLSNSEKRNRFMQYIEEGISGGYDNNNRYFAPFMNNSPIAWYTGGWYWSGSTRNHALINLYKNNDIFYDIIYEFCKGLR